MGALKRVKCGKSYVGSCEGLHGYLDGQPTSSAFGGFVAGLGVFSSRRRCWNHLQGELRYSSCGVVATGFPRLDYEDAVLMITLDHDAGTKTFRAPRVWFLPGYDFCKKGGMPANPDLSSVFTDFTLRGSLIVFILGFNLYEAVLGIYGEVGSVDVTSSI